MLSLTSRKKILQMSVIQIINSSRGSGVEDWWPSKLSDSLHMFIYLSCFLYFLMRPMLSIDMKKKDTITGTSVSKSSHLCAVFFFFFDYQICLFAHYIIFLLSLNLLKWTLVMKVMLLDFEFQSLLFHRLTLRWQWYKSNTVGK